MQHELTNMFKVNALLENFLPYPLILLLLLGKSALLHFLRQRVNAGGVPKSSRLLRLIPLDYFSDGVSPTARVDTKDTAISASGVTTLDWVAVSDTKKGMIYIKGGRGKGSGLPAR